jgi:hypothetical protein
MTEIEGGEIIIDEPVDEPDDENEPLPEPNPLGGI